MSLVPSLIDLLLNILDPKVLKYLWEVRRSFLRPAGIYEVLDHDANLEILDVDGCQAIYTKYQKVKFLQDNIYAYLDQAFGDGDLFADYRCSPGKPVDFYQDGNRWRVLISLRENKSRGQVEEFHIERRIEHGFTEKDGYFQTKIDHRTQHLTMSVVFPAKRYPSRLILVEENWKHTEELAPKHIQILPDNRYQVTWTTDKPRLYEAYTLRWTW